MGKKFLWQLLQSYYFEKAVKDCSFRGLTERVYMQLQGRKKLTVKLKLLKGPTFLEVHPALSSGGRNLFRGYFYKLLVF